MALAACSRLASVDFRSNQHHQLVSVPTAQFNCSNSNFKLSFRALICWVCIHRVKSPSLSISESYFMVFCSSSKFFIFIGQILSQMMRFGLALDNHSCLTLSVDIACLSSDILVMPIPVKTIPELFSRAFWVLPVAELADRDNLG